MTKKFYVFINILIFWVLVTAIDGLNPGSWGMYTALIVGGLVFALLALAVEPVLKFFKFPVNFWGLLVVGFVLNLIMFIIFSIGLLPPILTITTGSFGGGDFRPIPFPIIRMNSSILVAAIGSVIGTLLQILTRQLASLK